MYVELYMYPVFSMAGLGISQYQLLIPWSESNMFWKKRASSYKSVSAFTIKSMQKIHTMPLEN